MKARAYNVASSLWPSPTPLLEKGVQDVPDVCLLAVLRLQMRLWCRHSELVCIRRPEANNGARISTHIEGLACQYCYCGIDKHVLEPIRNQQLTGQWAKDEATSIYTILYCVYV